MSIVSAFAFFTKEDAGVDRQWTKAICAGSVCQDYLISCSDDEVVQMHPISGFVTLPEDWVDTRDDKLC